MGAGRGPPRLPGGGAARGRSPGSPGLMPTCPWGAWAEDEVGRTAPGQNPLHPGVTHTQHVVHTRVGVDVWLQ